MIREGWDKNFYIDEAMRDLVLSKNQPKVSIILSGIGVKYDGAELIDWCGIAYVNKVKCK